MATGGGMFGSIITDPAGTYGSIALGVSIGCMGEGGGTVVSNDDGAVEGAAGL